ncbi:MAG: hypothetical protein CBD82_02520 [Gammaproteobacteria bacterium TMED222]|jgi:hypothetical protein|nr:MAG: hypothetical protein CBD82_02520 [Gammaproteobacteria bacterium TMED222]
MTIAPLLEGFKCYFSTFKKFTLMTFPIFILLGLLASSGDIYLNDEVLFTWGILLFIFTNLFLTPFITSFCILIVNDLQKDGLKESIGYYIVSFQLILKVLLLTLITGLIVIGGLILFIVPGAYLASRLLYSPYFLILEGKTVLESLDLSWQTTKKNQKHFIFYLIYYWAALILITFFTLSIISAFAISSEPNTSLFFTNTLANAFLSYAQLVLISYPIFFIYKNTKTSLPI